MDHRSATSTTIPGLLAQVADIPPRSLVLPRRRVTDDLSQDMVPLTPEAVAALLGCDPQRVNALAAAHKLPAVKFGRSWRFPATALHQYLHEQALQHLTQPAPATATSLSSPPSRRRQLPDLTRGVKVE